MKLQIDNIRGVECAKLMREHFQDEPISIKAQVILPASMKYGSVEHYTYLFYSCILNYGMKSSILHSNLAMLYTLNPKFFTSKHILEEYSCKVEELAEILKTQVHVRYPSEAAKRWINLASVMLQHENNPANLFIGLDEYHEYENIILNIKGFGQKTGGLLLRMLIDADFVSPSDGVARIPIDRHDMALSLRLGVASGLTQEAIGKSKKAIEQLSLLWVNAAKEINLSPSLIDQYLWLIGSNFCAKYNCNNCPLHTKCFESGGNHETNIHSSTNV